MRRSIFAFFPKTGISILSKKKKWGRQVSFYFHDQTNKFNFKKNINNSKEFPLEEFSLDVIVQNEAPLRYLFFLHILILGGALITTTLYLSKPKYLALEDEESLEMVLKALEEGKLDTAFYELLELAYLMAAEEDEADTRSNGRPVYKKLEQALQQLNYMDAFAAEGLLREIFVRDLKKPGLYYLIAGRIAVALEKSDEALALLKLGKKQKNHVAIDEKLDECISFLPGANFGEKEPKQNPAFNKYLESNKKIKLFIHKYYPNFVENEPDVVPNRNLVIVRIWEPLGMNDFGHVSLQTAKHYISHWPEEGTWLTTKHGKRERVCDQSYFKDVRNEYARLPDKIFFLNALDADKINDEYGNMRKKGIKWALISSQLSIWTSWVFDTTVFNCATLSLFLLYEAGFGKIDLKRFSYKAGEFVDAVAADFEINIDTTSKSLFLKSLRTILIPTPFVEPPVTNLLFFNSVPLHTTSYLAKEFSPRLYTPKLIAALAEYELKYETECLRSKYVNKYPMKI